MRRRRKDGDTTRASAWPPVFPTPFKHDQIQENTRKPPGMIRINSSKHGSSCSLARKPFRPCSRGLPKAVWQRRLSSRRGWRPSVDPDVVRKGVAIVRAAKGRAAAKRTLSLDDDMQAPPATQHAGARACRKQWKTASLHGGALAAAPVTHGLLWYRHPICQGTA